VSSVAHPSGRLIRGLLDEADYVDCYSADIAARLSIEAVDRAAIQRGRLVERSPTEIVFVDHAPGLRFLVGYALAEQRLEITTAVEYVNRTGRRYFTVARPGHRFLVPWLIWWTARRAGRLR
jgi:hypothetical protein